MYIYHIIYYVYAELQILSFFEGVKQSKFQNFKIIK